MKKCNHLFNLDGGSCLRCGKTVSELIDEERERIDKGSSYDFRGQNEKWQRDSVKDRIKDDFKKYPDLLNEILSELRKDKLQNIKDKMNDGR